MSSLIRGLKFFHICYLGSCKNPGIYQTKYGECFCEKCVIKYINENGLDDFWPHGMREIIEIYNFKLLEQENLKKEEYLDSIFDKKNKPVKKRVRHK